MSLLNDSDGRQCVSCTNKYSALTPSKGSRSIGLSSSKQITHLNFLCVSGNGEMFNLQKTHIHDQEVRTVWMWIQLKQTAGKFNYSFLFHACRELMHLAVDLGCKHQVLMLILLQQASAHIVVSNDGHHTIKVYRGIETKLHVIHTSACSGKKSPWYPW